MKSVGPGSPPSNGSEYNEILHKKTDLQKAIKAVALALVLICSLAAVRMSPLGSYLDASNVGLLKDRFAELHAWAPVAFLLGGAVVIAMGLPRNIICLLGGALFGFLWGTVLSSAASILGSVPVYYLTRWLGRPLFHVKAGRYLQVIEGYVKGNEFSLVILLRQLPLTCMIVNVIMGLSSISFGAFFWGSIIGMLPEAIIFSLFGSGVREGFALRVSIASSLLILLVLIISIYFRKSPLAAKLSQGLMESKKKTSTEI